MDQLTRVESHEALPKERSKAFDQGLHVLDGLTEKLKERLTFGDLRLSDRFSKGDLHLLIHFGAKDSPEEWVACLTPVLPLEAVSLKQVVFSDSNKKAVFVDVVRVVEVPEQVIPTLVRFDRVDQFFASSPIPFTFLAFLPSYLSALMKMGKPVFLLGCAPGLPTSIS